MGIQPREALNNLSSLIMQAPQTYEKAQQEKHAAGTPRELFQTEESLMTAIQQMDEVAAQRAMDEAFLSYKVEEVCVNLIQAVLYRVGMLWMNNKLTITVEHFASQLIRTRLSHLFQSTPNIRQGPSILVGCAPREMHEIGALMLALFWRRAGLHVYYLGQMLETRSLIKEISMMRPGIVCLSAMMRPSVKDLANIAREISRMESPRPIFCFGGGVFGRNTELVRSVKGVYLGNNALAATQRIQELLRWQTAMTPDGLEEMLRTLPQ